jgi:FkbM family methyltransferase
MSFKIKYKKYECLSIQDYFFYYQVFFSSDIVGKPLKNFRKILYYERAQHLTFLFHRNILYEQNIWDNIYTYIKTSELIFDIGANIGQYALKFSEVVGQEGRVICFEPDYKNFSFLNFNININKCKNVECLNMGLGMERNDKVFFRDTKTGGRMGSFDKLYVRDKFEGNTEIVKVDTIANMVEIYGVPDFVKIDVEGFEESVVNGAEEFNTKTKYLIEIRDKSKENIYNIFAKNNFQCYLVDNRTIKKN